MLSSNIHILMLFFREISFTWKSNIYTNYEYSYNYVWRMYKNWEFYLINI